MYEQTLVNIIDDHIKPHVLKRVNKGKKWVYGYNKDHDVVVIRRLDRLGIYTKYRGLR